MGSTSELYNSNYCRLCGEDSQQPGIFIFEGNSTSDNVSVVINKYLPVNVVDDGKLPRTICSNCHIQLFATITFFDLLSVGQEKLTKLVSPDDLESSISAIENAANSITSLEREKKKIGKRRRGRPRKVFMPAEIPEKEEEVPSPEEPELIEDIGKSRRKRKLPSRFSYSIQGKELEKVFREVGLPEEEAKVVDPSADPEVIGKVETSNGENLGEVMVQQLDEETKLQQLKYRCDICEKVFMPERAFLNHECIAKESTIPAVDVDQAVPDAKESELEKNSPYKCDLCQKKFKCSSSLSYHKEAEHSDGRRYVCNKCHRFFKHRQLLKNHQHVHSSVRLFKCEDCGASFKTKNNLINHTTLHTGNKKYFCEFCGQLFAHKTSLTLHLRMHNGEKPFECETCHKRFTQKGNLIEHMRIHTGEKPFECHICERRFTTSSQCKLHLKRHTGEKPWSCICGKSFLNRSTWKCHIRRHKGENPYECKECGKTFPEDWALRKHIRTHTGEKPYKCPLCDKAFADCSNLTKHKKTHAKDKVVVDGTKGEQIIYVTYPDPLNPAIEISERFIVTHVVPEGGTEEEEGIMQVMDEMGNPLKFTFQDGTQLQVTTRDGKSLEVRTPDGQTIPVRLTTDAGEPVYPDLTPIVVPAVDENFVDINNIELVTTEDQAQTITLPEGFIQIA